MNIVLFFCVRSFEAGYCVFAAGILHSGDKLELRELVFDYDGLTGCFACS